MSVLKLKKSKYFPGLILFLTGLICTDIELLAQESKSLSMDEAISLALKNNSEISIAEYRVNSAEYSVEEAKGNYLPKVSFIGTYNRNIDKQVIFLPEGFGVGGATEIGSDNNFSAYLDLSVPLYSRANTSGKHYAYGNFQLQSEVLRGMKQAVTVNVRKNYFNHLIGIEIVRVRERALENSIENYNVVKNKLAEGVVTEFDETTAKVKITIARNNLLEAQSRTVVTANNLKLIVGLPIEEEIRLTDSLSVTESELQFSEDASDLLHNSIFKQRELKADAARQQTTLVRAGFFPTLSATGTYQFQSQENNFDFPKYDWVNTSALGLRLQIPLFNGTITRSKVQQAIMSQKIAEAEKEYTTKNNRSQFYQFQSQLNYARQRIALQEDNIDVARKAAALVKERYNYGKSTFLEVNNAELEYVTARLNYLQAVMDYKNAFYDLELLTAKEN